MKKIVSLLVVLAIVASTAFAVPIAGTASISPEPVSALSVEGNVFSSIIIIQAREK